MVWDIQRGKHVLGHQSGICFGSALSNFLKIPLQDFVECAAEDREPISNFDLAAETLEVIYAAYLSAESGCRVDL